MNSTQVRLVQESFTKVVPISEQAAVLFYDRLFEIAPVVKAMFPADMLLSGKSMDGLANAGPIVCACFGVGRTTISDAIAAGARSVAEIGVTLKAGTNCGSCIPEMKRLIAQTGTGDPEQRKLVAAN